MWLHENKKRVKAWVRSVLIFLGTLFVFFLVINAVYIGKNIETFFGGHLAKETSVAVVAPALVEPDTLSIPSLNIIAPVIYITEKNTAVYDAALAQGVVHYPGTAMPGELGNVYIFGHSSDLPWSTGKYKTVFAALPQITPGEQILLSDHEGKLFTYTVFETRIVSPKDLSVLDQYENKEKILSLQTSYPLGTALQRFIVLARIEEEN